MKSFFVMGHLLVMALMVITGTFVALGLPVTDQLMSTVIYSVAWVCFERIAKICKVYE